MTLKATARVGAAVAVAFVIACATGLHGAAAQEKAKPGNPVGGPGWNAQVGAAPPSDVSGIELDPQQLAILRKVSAYFADLANLKGTFVQTTPDKKRMRGKFYVKKPGRLRFEYSLPSRQLIVSDGSYLAIQDLDMNTDDRIALDQTPFRLLLRTEVDLLRDARILEVQEAEDLVVVSLQDRSPDAPGRIRLFLAKTPALELKEWVTTDAQGGDTRLEVANLVTADEIEAGLFKIVTPSLRMPQQ